MEKEKQLYVLVLQHNYNTVAVIQYSFDVNELEAIADALNSRDGSCLSGWRYIVENA